MRHDSGDSHVERHIYADERFAIQKNGFNKFISKVAVGATMTTLIHARRQRRTAKSLNHLCFAFSNFIFGRVRSELATDSPSITFVARRVPTFGHASHPTF